MSRTICFLQPTWMPLLAVMAIAMFCVLTPVANSQQEIDDSGWRYTLGQPAENWSQPDFDDSGWHVGAGGFGTRSTPGSRVGTEWRTNDIWLRRTVNVSVVPERPALLMHHDEDVDVYINGMWAVRVEGWVTEYEVLPLEAQVATKLKPGENLIAVHCRQTRGGQFIDVHLVDADTVPSLPPAKRLERPFLSELITPWGERVTAENAWQEYPRPMMTRANWINLNGKWNFAVTERSQQKPPADWDGEILVPFCLESKLGGVQRLLHEDQALWYQRKFEVTPVEDCRVLINFEAVDYECQMFVNGIQIGTHRGGNTPFNVDATEALREGVNTLTVRVIDATEAAQLRGKQTLFPKGIWYTRVSGIWQTVWMEMVPLCRIDDLKITTDAEAGSIQVAAELSGEINGDEHIRMTVQLPEGAIEAMSDYRTVEVSIPSARRWSPASPYLYSLTVELLDGEGQVLDTVESYAGIRTIGRIQDADGHWRMTLNGRVVFPWGPLDQGWWPDGLLTPPSDEAMRWDLEFLKSAGFNMVRKHIKVEPRRYYYHCDRLGMMVWQDQVSGGRGPAWTRLAPDPRDAEWTASDHAKFMAEFEAMVDGLENHPSIVVWIPFNEAWGQHQTREVGKWIADRDPTRLVNIASGGNFWPVGDIVDQHSYPQPSFPFDPGRYVDYIKVVGEFGGHGLAVPGHLWDPLRDNWGYGGLPKNTDEYRQRYVESIRQLVELTKRGIAAAVYTQTTDVEGEVNGLLTYDRRHAKISADELKTIHEPLHAVEPAHGNVSNDQP